MRAVIFALLCLGLACKSRSAATGAARPASAKGGAAASTSTEKRDGPDASGIVEHTPCVQDVGLPGTVASIPGVLVIAAQDGQSPSHGLGDVAAGRYRLGNLTPRPLQVEVTGLELRVLGDPTLRRAYVIKAITAEAGASIAGSTVILDPGACVAIQVFAEGSSSVPYHVRATYEATFTALGSSIVARSDDMFFRYPLRPRP